MSLKANASNKHRTFGALLAGTVQRDPALASAVVERGLRIDVAGVGGLSFGMGLHKGMEIVVDGPVNHGAGKALSGGTVIAQVMGDQVRLCVS